MLQVAQGVRGVVGLCFLQMCNKSLSMSLGMEKSQGQLELWNFKYKWSHSELCVLLHNKGTRRYLMALNGLELKTKGHNFLCFVF